MEIKTDIRVNNRIAQLHHSRKCRVCDECDYLIPVDTDYYSVTIGGGGLGNLKHPDHVHVDCLDKFLRGSRK